MQYKCPGSMSVTDVLSHHVQLGEILCCVLSKTVRCCWQCGDCRTWIARFEVEFQRKELLRVRGRCLTFYNHDDDWTVGAPRAELIRYGLLKFFPKHDDTTHLKRGNVTRTLEIDSNAANIEMLNKETRS